jgi:hypothetical protein
MPPLLEKASIFTNHGYSKLLYIFRGLIFTYET